jgi:hypothetical protein
LTPPDHLSQRPAVILIAGKMARKPPARCLQRLIESPVIPGAADTFRYYSRSASNLGRSVNLPGFLVNQGQTLS